MDRQASITQSNSPTQSNFGRQQLTGNPRILNASATPCNPARQQAFDNPVSVEASPSGEWPLGASMDRKKLRRISSALKDQPASPQSPSVKQWLPGGEDEPLSPQSQSPRRAMTKRRAWDQQPSSPSRHSATAVAGSSAANRGITGGGDLSEPEAQRNQRQQAVNQLKAMLQSDPRMATRESADGGVMPF